MSPKEIEIMKSRPSWPKRVARIDIQIRKDQEHNAMDTTPQQFAEVVTNFLQTNFVGVALRGHPSLDD